MLTTVPIVAQNPPATPAISCDTQLEKCRLDIATKDAQLAAFNSKIPGKGLMWKILHFNELDGPAKMALIIEAGVMILVIGASAYSQTATD